MFERCLRTVRRTKNQDVDAIAKNTSDLLSQQGYLGYWARMQPHWWWDPAQMMVTAQSSYV
jgi:hypothetical protein